MPEGRTHPLKEQNATTCAFGVLSFYCQPPGRALPRVFTRRFRWEASLEGLTRSSEISGLDPHTA